MGKAMGPMRMRDALIDSMKAVVTTSIKVVSGAMKGRKKKTGIMTLTPRAARKNAKKTVPRARRADGFFAIPVTYQLIIRLRNANAAMHRSGM
jgi:hypothetical protein